MPEMDLGGGYGIGHDSAVILAKAGADVAVADLDLDRAKATQAELEAKIDEVAGDPAIVAVASDDRPGDTALPWFRRDDVVAIADFIAARVPPPRRRRSAGK